MSGSNLSREANYPEYVLTYSSPDPPDTCHDSTVDKSEPLPSLFFLITHAPTDLL
jgi:hypothetical protein